MSKEKVKEKIPRFVYSKLSYTWSTVLWPIEEGKIRMDKKIRGKRCMYFCRFNCKRNGACLIQTQFKSIPVVRPFFLSDHRLLQSHLQWDIFPPEIHLISLLDDNDGASLGFENASPPDLCPPPCFPCSHSYKFFQFSFFLPFCLLFLHPSLVSASSYSLSSSPYAPVPPFPPVSSCLSCVANHPMRFENLHKYNFVTCGSLPDPNNPSCSPDMQNSDKKFWLAAMCA